MTYEELNKQINVMKAEIEHKSVQLAALRIAEIEDAIFDDNWPKRPTVYFRWDKSVVLEISESQWTIRDKLVSTANLFSRIADVVDFDLVHNEYYPMTVSQPKWGAEYHFYTNDLGEIQKMNIHFPNLDKLIDFAVRFKLKLNLNSMKWRVEELEKCKADYEMVSSKAIQFGLL